MKRLIEGLSHYLDNSPTPWHAVALASKQLAEAGFELLDEKEGWKLKPGGRYQVIRSGGAIAAFVMPKNSPTVVHLVGAHTDSPALKLKPNAEFQKEDMILLGVEIYGGPLLSSWLNRDLGIAGRVFYRNSRGSIKETLVRLDEYPVMIPQLAIHLDKNVNETGLILNKQEHLSALAGFNHGVKKTKGYLEELIRKKVSFTSLLAHDLFLFPLEKSSRLGKDNQLIASARLDNLASAHAAISAMIQGKSAASHAIKMMILWDHEEVGSSSERGAASPFASHLLERIVLLAGKGREEWMRLMSSSLCLSVDLSHALHPNYPDKHEPRHPLILGKGIAIKTNAQQRYASDGSSVAKIVNLCESLKVPYQRFVSRNDLASGTTIGPIHAHTTGMATIDIGYPELSMHSCREVAACADHEALCKLLEGFINSDL